MYKLLLIWRYFIKKRVALIAVLAVTMLVMMILVVLSLMSGLLEEARRRNHAWTGDLVLSRDSLVGFPYYDEFIARLRQNENVLEATPVISTFALIDSDNPGQLIGVRLNEFCRVTDFADSLFYARSGSDLKPDFTIPRRNDSFIRSDDFTDEQRLRGCIVGSGQFGTRFRMAINGGTGLRLLEWRFIVFGLNSRGALTGSDAGEHQTFWNVDEFETDLIDVDEAILVDFDQLQQLCWMHEQPSEPARTSEIRIRLTPDADVDSARTEIAAFWDRFVAEKTTDPDTQRYASLLDDVALQSWQQYRRDFIAPVENERTLMIVVFGMIAVVAVFIIFAIFYMIVTEKIKDLGIIKSLGGSRGSLAQIFLGYGLLVGLIGAGLGTACGWAIVTHSNQIEAWLTEHFDFVLWNPEVYAIDRIPDVVDPHQAFVIALVAVLASLAGAAFPAHRAASLNVIDALRVE